MTRLDVELVNRGLAPTRTKAQDLIKSNLVKCNNHIVSKSNFDVKQTEDLEILQNDKLKYVSRAGLKLEKAIIAFKVDLSGLTIMDIGSSTGGFTDCAIRYGAKKVIAIDVGTDLMDHMLRRDPRVELHEQTNFKDLDHNMFTDVDLMVCDVSFISLKHIIKKLFDEKVKTDIICLIKPQFECGKEIAKKFKGVILDRDIHISIIRDLLVYFNDYGFYLQNITISPIKGGDGNIEYLVKLSNKINTNLSFDVERTVDEAFKVKD